MAKAAEVKSENLADLTLDELYEKYYDFTSRKNFIGEDKYTRAGEMVCIIVEKLSEPQMSTDSKVAKSP